MKVPKKQTKDEAVAEPDKVVSQERPTKDQKQDRDSQNPRSKR